MSNVVRVKFGTKNAIKGPFELVNGTDYNLFLPNGRMIGKLIKDHKTGVFYSLFTRNASLFRARMQSVANAVGFFQPVKDVLTCIFRTIQEHGDQDSSLQILAKTNT